ncbi:serine/threonine-protein kinase HipA [Maribacter dokdonensis]|uniref:HipA domain-containing protein n=1 Tax=Maribacter dokdonensis TaxID=320912 RepID=UPI001B21211F|nr:HipA domain-containing protein [Maribacter dokdonensis]CAG2531774.1 serine/threonine-protein kinase HipA [Maribacter dokdonensis]
MNRCLYCYKEIDGEGDFHKSCSLEFFGTETPPKIEYSLNQMSELAEKVVERSIAVPGVQPKLSMSVLDESGKESRLTVVGALGGNYIFKPPSKDFQEMPANEHLTMKMAKLLNIEVVPHSLIRLSSGELSYITKRIDREEDGTKIHMLDMFQITEAFDKYKGSMERIGKAITSYAENTLLDKLRFFEMTIFSYLTGNNDMHLKNFSMIKTSYGWALSPAYDLLNVAILNPEDAEEMALSIGGKKRKLKKDHFIEFALNLGLNKKQIAGVLNRFNGSIDDIQILIKSSFLSEEMQRLYIEIFFDRIKIITK